MLICFSMIAFNFSLTTLMIVCQGHPKCVPAKKAVIDTSESWEHWWLRMRNSEKQKEIINDTITIYK